jgi:succinylarginine dihydrolase
MGLVFHCVSGLSRRLTKEANGNGPELIVLGRDDQGKPRAARFPSDQANLVAKAAQAMNLTACKARRWPSG